MGFKIVTVFSWFFVSFPLTKSIYHSILLNFLLCLLPYITATNLSQPYTPTDFILLNCGASSNATSLDGRIWESDAKSKFRAFNSETSSSSIKPSQQDPSVTQVPYMTARIFNSMFTYAFPVLPGSKFVRLYFYPASYSDLDITKSFFSIKSNNYTLVKNFSAFLTVSASQPPVAVFTKEFIVTVLENQVLNITFYPSPNSFAFINGIEIVPLPNGLYQRGDDNQLNYVGINHPFYLDNTTALETLYRQNVGGQVINEVDDTGMYRKWLLDFDYIFGAAVGITSIYNGEIKYTMSTPKFVAPPLVYRTMRSMGPDPNINRNYNLTWIFPIDGGFNYLVRLHVCETRKEITKIGQLVFTIYINNQTAEAQADVIYWGGLGTGFNGVPLYRDYVVWVPAGSHGKQDLCLALHPYVFDNKGQQYIDAILNGLEIFKLNNSEGSLARSNLEPRLLPALSPDPTLINRRKSKQSKVFIVIGSVIGSILALAFVICFFFLKRRKAKKEYAKSERNPFHVPFSRVSRLEATNSTTSISSSLPTDRCHRFSIAEIIAVPKNFNDQNFIGSGGFGSVYKGYIESGSISGLVAIKRLDSLSKQGTHEFVTEIEMLSQLRHVNLISLIGYCIDEGEMILVYNYMINDTLRDHLYETSNNRIPWKKRLQICIGVARGLHYLHSEFINKVIHRDVRTTNILLDEKWIAKVSDFGLSKVALNKEVSTIVKGTWGYLDPEYARYQQLIEKSDVYSFGVVLFEVFCAGKAINQDLEHEEINLANWAKKCIHKGNFYEIIDPYLIGKVDPHCFNKFVEIAFNCIRNKGIERPNMRNVMGELEFALELQKAADAEKMATNPDSEIVYSEVSFVVA